MFAMTPKRSTEINHPRCSYVRLPTILSFPFLLLSIFSFVTKFPFAMPTNKVMMKRCMGAGRPRAHCRIRGSFSICPWLAPCWSLVSGIAGEVRA